MLNWLFVPGIHAFKKSYKLYSELNLPAKEIMFLLYCKTRSSKVLEPEVPVPSFSPALELIVNNMCIQKEKFNA